MAGARVATNVVCTCLCTSITAFSTFINIYTSNHIYIIIIVIIIAISHEYMIASSKLSLIWMGLYTFTYVCVDSSRTVPEHHRFFIPSTLVTNSKPAGRRKPQGSHRESNPGSPVQAAGAVTTEPQLPTATWAMGSHTGLTIASLPVTC